MSLYEELVACKEKSRKPLNKKATLPPKKPGSNTTFCSLALIDVEREIDELKKQLEILENKKEEILRQGEGSRSSYFC